MRPILAIFGFLLLTACSKGCGSDCPETNGNILVVRVFENDSTESDSLPYNQLKLVETGEVFKFPFRSFTGPGYNDFFPNYIPLDPRRKTTTFVLTGNGFSDSIRFSSLPIKGIYNEDCGLQYDFENPEIAWSSFRKSSLVKWDQDLNIFEFTGTR